VHAAAHVLDVHIPQSAGPTVNHLGNLAISQAVHVPHVKRLSDLRRINEVAHLGELFHPLDEHARFRLER
jgi:hypothetical protein